MKKNRVPKIGVGITVGAIVLLGTPALTILVSQSSVSAQHQNPATPVPSANNQKIVVHLTHGTDDLHAVFMALKLASNLQKQGAQVTLLLTLEGVRIVDVTQPLDLRWGKKNMTLAELYQDFLSAGGTVRVCPVCAEAVGIDANSLRPGAQLAVENNDIPSLILGADKVLGF
ncbi:DsrE family protein [Microseira sp. BLCC-F43]|jgi:predicted peroxiredoxin|uniref:DsrE family protein n=1 Tax=Microseira sp. BLCC-F43 TaxID=3153602 RepID=UPI0035B910C3